MEPVIQVTGINHVVLHVRDVEASVRFYTEVLGFQVRTTSVDPARRMRFLRCGNQGLDLFEIAGDVHGGEEMNHMALDAEAVDVDELAERFARAGITDLERTPRDSLYVLDPDGHRIEMLPHSSLERTRQRAATSAVG